MTRVKCEFVGVVNGVPVTIGGRGHVSQAEDPERSRLDLEQLTDFVPLGFDSALVALVAADLVLLVARLKSGSGGDDAAQHADDGVRLHAHLDFQLLDENYREMGGFEIAATVSVDTAGIEVVGQFIEARTCMEPTERVVSAGDTCSTTTVALGRDGLVLTTANSFGSDFGNGYVCVAVSRVVGLGEGWEPSSGLDVLGVTLERAGGRKQDCRVKVGAEIRPGRSRG